MVKRKNITTTQLALMTAAAVISLRGLPMMAQEELTMFFYIFFATFLFLIPAALVGAELGSAFADRGGGVYTWVKEAFNRPLGFSAIFLQWIQNVVWYPTVLGFAAASIAYLIGMPDLSQNGLYVGLFSIAMYWIATLVTLRGTDAASSITSKGFLIGTVLPGIVVIVMAIVWLATGNPDSLRHIPAEVTQVVNIDAAHHVHPRLFPHISGMSDIAFLAGILLLFAGVEVHAVHAPELQKPQTQFPKAMFLAALISFALFTLGALAVAIITPYDQINLQSGLFTTYRIVFEHYHVGWLSNVMGLLVAFGALAGVMSWISGPSRGLLWTAREGVLPCFLQKTNKNGVQVNILIIQGCIVSLLSSLYIFMNDVSVAFFLLSALTVGLYLIMYMMMYASGIRLRYTQPQLKRSYRIPGGNAGMWFVAGIGFLAVLFAFIVCFFPPSQLPVGRPATYTWLVVIGTVVFLSIPFIISSAMARRKGRPCKAAAGIAATPDAPAAPEMTAVPKVHAAPAAHPAPKADGTTKAHAAGHPHKAAAAPEPELEAAPVEEELEAAPEQDELEAAPETPELEAAPRNGKRTDRSRNDYREGERDPKDEERDDRNDREDDSDRENDSGREHVSDGRGNGPSRNGSDGRHPQKRTPAAHKPAPERREPPKKAPAPHRPKTRR